MKKHLSVLMLHARSTVYKLLAALVFMTAAEAALFYITVRRLQDTNLMGLEYAFTEGKIVWVFCAAFVLFCAVLLRSGYEFGSKQGYTLRRLRVSEEAVFIWQAVYNTVCLFILWAFQLLVVMGLSMWYMSVADASVSGGQTIFLAFYRDEFLHSLMPLAEGSRLARNLILVPCLGTALAALPWRQRRGQKGIAGILLPAVAVVSFKGEMGLFAVDAIVSMAAIVMAGSAALGVLWKELRDED